MICPKCKKNIGKHLDDQPAECYDCGWSEMDGMSEAERQEHARELVAYLEQSDTA